MHRPSFCRRPTLHSPSATHHPVGRKSPSSCCWPTGTGFSTDRPTDVKLGARRSPRAQLLIKYSRKASRYGAATDGQMRESDTSVQSASSISLYVQHNSATWLRKWQTVLFSDCDRHTAINNEMANDKWQSSSNAITNNFVEASSFLTENWLNKKLGYCRETAQRSVSHRSQSPNKIRLTWVKYDVTGDLKST